MRVNRTLNIMSLHYIITQHLFCKIQHMCFLRNNIICYNSESLKLMVPFLRCKLINDRRKGRMKGEKGEQVEAGDTEEWRGKTRKLLSAKGGHRCAEQKSLHWLL